jgi:tyrosinase
MSGSFSLTRRDFLLGTVATLATLSLPEWLADQAFAQTGPRIRYEANTPQGKAMLVIYRDGVKRMKALPKHDPRSWNFQANIHAHPENEPLTAIFAPSQGKTAAAKAIIARNKRIALGNSSQKGVWNTCPHGTTADNGYYEHFVSWHRMYVLFLERTIATLTNKPNFALPYWEYSHPNAKALGRLKLPREFTTPAAASNALWSADRSARVLRDGLTEGAVGPRLAFDQLTLLGTADENGFNAVVDETPHGNVHVAIGTTKRIGGQSVPVGMQSIEVAARDPIFWMHHCNVDRMWESWRRPRPNGSSTFDPPASNDWRNRSFTFVDPKDPSKLVSMKAGEVLNVQSAELGYKYDGLASVADATSFSSATRQAPVQLQAQKVAQNLPQIQGLDQPITVPVAPTAPPPVTLGFGNRPDTEYTLKIDVEAEKEPGGLFEVYVLALKAPGGAEKSEQLVGTFNLFGLGKHQHHTTPGTKPGKTWRADITELVLRKLIDPSKPAEVVFKAAFNAPTVPVTIKSVSIEAR